MKRILVILVTLFTLGWGLSPAKAELAAVGRFKDLDSLYQQLKQLPEDTLKVATYKILWETYFNASPDSALLLAEAGLELSEKLNYRRGIGWAKAGVGFAFLSLGQNEKAFESLYEARELFEKLQLPEELAYSISYIGSCHAKIDEYQPALNHFHEALRIFEENELTVGIAYTLGNIGFTYQKMGDYDKALLYLSRSLASNKSLGLRGEMGVVNMYIGQVFDDLGDHNKALESYFKALELLSEDKFIGLAHTYIGVSYNEIGRAKQAIDYAKKGIEILTRGGFNNELAEAYRSLSDIYFTLNDYKNSLEYYRLFTTLRNNVRTQQSGRVIAEIQARYDAAKKEQENMILREQEAQKDEELQRKNLLVTAATILVLLLIIFVYILYRNNQQRKETVEQLNLQKEEIRKKSDELTAYNEKLQDLAREKDGLISIVAHDLKSPLNKVKGFTQLVPMVGELNDEQKDYMERINGVVEEGISLIRDLLDINSIESQSARFETRDIDLVAFINDTIGQFEQSATDKDIQIRFEPNGHAPKLHTDAQALGRVVDNLVSNAIKFSPKGKVITIDAKDDDDLIFLEVADQGPGIPVEDHEKMFKKFQRLSAQPTAGESSHGLGLAIVKSLVDRMQGEIEVDSQPGKGAIFRIILPKEPV